MYQLWNLIKLFHSPSRQQCSRSPAACRQVCWCKLTIVSALINYPPRQAFLSRGQNCCFISHLFCFHKFTLKSHLPSRKTANLFHMNANRKCNNIWFLTRSISHRNVLEENQENNCTCLWLMITNLYSSFGCYHDNMIERILLLSLD